LYSAEVTRLSRQAIVCRGLGKTYLGPVPVTALAEATFTIERGEMVALVGRSGSGKSTLLTLMGLLDDPTTGDLHIAGVETTTLSRRERDQVRSRDIGFVFQAFNLVQELSARDNVEMALRYQGAPRRERRSRAHAALELVGLAHRITARVGTLSGGEQQRVALARALVKDPTVVLADEPTGNLDTANEQLVIDLLRDAAARGTTVIVVTHSTSLAQCADRALTLHDGVVVQEAG
jgi:putative ABC transport system ATP-binding protein